VAGAAHAVRLSCCGGHALRAWGPESGCVCIIWLLWVDRGVHRCAAIRPGGVPGRGQRDCECSLAGDAQGRQANSAMQNNFRVNTHDHGALEVA